MAQGITGKVRDLAVRNRAVYWALRTVRQRALGALPPRRLEGIPGRVHRNDLMLEAPRPDLVANYAATGRAAADFVGDAIIAAGRDWASIGALLDFGCGHGRVLRHFATHLPGSAITACDLDPEAIRFCRREFGAHALQSDFDIDAVALTAYDVIWLGSVLTHLDEPVALATFGRLVDSLRPGGIITFSTHSEALIPVFAEARRGELEAALRDQGMVYAAYQHYRDEQYGIAFHKPAYVRDTLAAAGARGLRELDHRPMAWSGRHDLWAFQVS